MTTKMKFLLLVAIAGFAGAVGAGCSPPHDDSRGNVSVEVVLPDGVAINNLTYTLSGNQLAPLVEVLPVRGSPTSVIALFTGIPVGHGYQVSASAISRDGLTTCAAGASADIHANRTTSVVMPLVCTSLDGKVVVVATFHCSLISSLVAAPMTTSVGGEIDLQAGAGGDAGTIGFTWSGGSGTFSNPTAATTVFTCTSAGTASITLTASSGQCSDHVTISVSCIPASNGNHASDAAAAG